MDATIGGAFLLLTIPQATTLVEMMASNKGWNEKRTQTRKKSGGMHQLKVVDMLSAQISLLMKCGGIDPYTLLARLGPGGLAHYETSSRFDPTAWSFAQGNKMWRSSRILVG